LWFESRFCRINYGVAALLADFTPVVKKFITHAICAGDGWEWNIQRRERRFVSAGTLNFPALSVRLSQCRSVRS
jgi:hypothetical protein